MIGEEAPSAEGVLKMNCKVLDSSQLKKLDKQEKVLAQEIHSTGKGESVSHPVHCMVIFINNVILLQTKWESFEGGKISRKACLCSKLNLTIIHTINNSEP